MAAEWHRPTGHESGPWNDKSKAYDEDENSWAYMFASDYSWTGWLTLTHEGLTSTQAKIKVFLQDPYSSAQVEVYKDGAWEQVYSGSEWEGWKTFTYDEGLVTKIRLQAYKGGTKSERARCNDVQIYGESPPSDAAAAYSFVM